MTVSSTDRSSTHACNGVTTVFTAGFRVLAADEIRAFLITAATDEVYSELTYSTDFTVSNVGASSATVTTAVAHSSTYELRLLRETARAQEQDYIDGDAFPAEALESGLDRLTFIAQEIDGAVERTIRVPEGEVLSELPNSANRASKLLGFTSTGQLTVTATVSGTAADLALDLASFASATEGAGQVGYSATLAYGDSTIGGHARQFPTAKDYPFSAVGDGVADDTAAIVAWIAHLKTLTAPIGILPAGTYKVTSALTFDLPNDSTLIFVGTISSNVSAGSAVKLGSSSANRFRWNVQGLKVTRTANDYTGSSVGVEMVNLAWSKLDVRQCTGFRIGVQAHGSTKGFTYNNIELGHIHDNRTNLQLAVTDAASGGYCNECDWFGGSLNHSSTYDVVTYNGINLEITHNATNTLNNHGFYGLSLEDAHASSTNTVAAIINGANNVLFSPRVERISGPTTYQIQFTADSNECQIIGNGFSFSNSNIDDLGTGNNYETREGAVMTYSTPNTAGKAVLRLRSINTSAARCLSVVDAGGAEVLYITGEGDVYLADTNNLRFVANGTSYANDAAAAAGGISVGQSYRNGSVLQLRVV